MFIKNRLKSIGFACSGILHFIRKETHAKIHFLSTITVISLSVCFQIDSRDWLLIVFAIGIVVISEMLNTSIEKTLDLISPDYNDKVKYIKDVAAGAVLVAAVISMIIGGLVFAKYF